MTLNLVDRDLLIKNCQATIDEIKNSDKYTPEEVILMTIENEYAISLLEACNSITLSFKEE